MKKLLISIILATLILPTAVLGQGTPPPLPLLVYGDVTLYGNPAPVGTIILIEKDNTEIAKITLTTAGKYSTQISASYSGSTLSYKVNGTLVTQKIAANPMTTGSDKIDLAVGSAPSGGGGGGGGVISTPPTNVSVSINTGAASTDNRNVRLTLSATNATYMTIANEPTFANTSFETYSATKDWTLTEGIGQKTVYVRFRSSSSGTIDSSDTIDLTSSVATPLTPTPTPTPTGQVLGAQAFADGAIIRAKGGIDVYIVKYVPSTGSGQVDKQFKRLILSPSVFNSYKHLKWSDVLDVDQSVIDSFVTSDLVRVVGNTKVYKLTPSGDKGSKQWIKTAAAFNSRSFDWSAIYEINSVDRNSYKTGTNLE